MRAASPAKAFGQNLDRYVAAQLGIVSAVNLSHPTSANGGQDFVGAQVGAGRQGHLAFDYSSGNEPRSIVISLTFDRFGPVRRFHYGTK
jgi:hypothetical protein